MNIIFSKELTANPTQESTMKVEVQLINEKGRGIPTKDRSFMPKYRGRLRIREARSQAFGRIVNMSDLLSLTCGTEDALLPSLHDASVIFLNKGTMRIRGFEVINGVQYGQTWDLVVS
jgi:hypothetical protein